MKSEDHWIGLCLCILVLVFPMSYKVSAESNDVATDLGGNTGQTDNGAVKVLYVGEGTATSTTTTTTSTLPLTVSVSGNGNTSVGGNVSYIVSLSNPNPVSRGYDLGVSGIDSGWYRLSKSVGVLLAYESVNLSLVVFLPQDCGVADVYSFNVSIGSSGVIASLSVSPEPKIDNLLPVDPSVVSSVDVLFSWRASSDSTSVLYIKSDNEMEYRNISGESGLLHSVVASNLSRNTGYSWHVESCSVCGCAQSENRSFHVDNGVTFTQRTYGYSVERDYNQHTSVSIHNTDTMAHTLLLGAFNPYDDLIVGFTGNGSVDQNVTVPPGETVNVDFMVHAQDAVLGEYDIPVSLKNLDADNISDNAVVHVSVRIPNINFTLTEVGVDNHTLAKTYEIHNYGDTLTDLMVYADDAIKSNVTFNPVINHGKLDSGASTRFEVIPTLYANFINLSGMIYAQDPETSGGAVFNAFVPENKSVFPVLIDDGELCVRFNDWYCTNRPNISERFTLPSAYDSMTVYEGELFASFDPYSDVRSHSVFFGMNGMQVGSLENIVPRGPYNFSFPGSYMHGGSNVLGINTVHLNGGHYVVATGLKVCSCVSNYSAWVVALNQSEADGYVNDFTLVKKVPDNIGVEIISPIQGETINTTTLLIKAQVDSPLLDMAVVARTCTDSVMLLYDDGLHEDGEANDNVYAYTWSVSQGTVGNCTIAVSTSSCDVGGEDSVDVIFEEPVTTTTTTTSSSTTTTTSSTTATTSTTTTTTVSSTTTTTSGTTTTTFPSACYDGVKNNGETGVDCGTVCNKTCCSYSTTCGGGLCCKKVSHSTGVCCSQGQSCNVIVGNPYCS